MKALYLPLWYLCDFSSKYKGLDKHMQTNIVKINQCTAQQAKDFDAEKGTIPVYTAGMAVYHTTRDIAGDYVCDMRNVIGIGNALSLNTVKLLDAPFVCANNHLAVVRDQDIVLPKFLYNVLKHSVKIERHFRGVTLRTACMDEILKLNIPVPPMAYQKEVVGWLDAVEAKSAQYQRHIDELDLTINHLINH